VRRGRIISPEIDRAYTNTHAGLNGLMPRYTAAQRLDRLPICRFHRRILFLIGAGMFLDYFDAMLQGSVLGALTASQWSTLNLNAQFISATFLGMLVGSFLSGVLGDRYGRRFTYQVNLLVIGLTSLAAAFAPSMRWLIGCRLIMGLGLGAEIVIGYSTLTEFVPPRSRGRWLAWLALITDSAVAVSALAGYFVIPAFGWRPMFALAGAGALVVWKLRAKMPESPRWLESVGRTDEADRIMAEIEAEARGALSDAKLPEPKVGDAHETTQPRAGLRILFSRAVIRRTLLGSLITITINVVIYGLLSWLPTFMVMERLGVSESLRYTMLMSLGAPIGPLIAGFLADRIGRRVSLAVTSVVAAALGAAYALVPTIQAATVVGFFLFLVLYLIVALGLASYVPELFPTAYRLRGAGVCMTAGRAGAALVPWFTVWAYSRGGIAVILEVFCGLLLFQGLAVILFGINTENRSLEELAPKAGTDEMLEPRILEA
jgi:MFS transporter, putative metabolite:H+ symporter